MYFMEVAKSHTVYQILKDQSNEKPVFRPWLITSQRVNAKKLSDRLYLKLILKLHVKNNERSIRLPLITHTLLLVIQVP